MHCLHEPSFLYKSHIIFLFYIILYFIVLILFYFIFLIFLISFILFNYSFYFICFILLFYFINIILYCYYIFIFISKMHLLNAFLNKMNLKYFFQYRTFSTITYACVTIILPSEVRQIERALNWSMEYALMRTSNRHIGSDDANVFECVGHVGV